MQIYSYSTHPVYWMRAVKVYFYEKYKNALLPTIELKIN